MCDVIIAYIGLHHTLLHLLSLFALLALKSYYCIACFSCGRKPSQICASVVIRECSQRIGKSKQGHHQTGGYFSLIKKKPDGPVLTTVPFATITAAKNRSNSGVDLGGELWVL